MMTGATIRRLKALKKAVLADGKVDWDETGSLLECVRPLAAKHGLLFQEYELLLKKCREDGKITEEESARLALQLDYLCGYFTNRRLRFWLAVTSVLLLAAASFVIGERVFVTAGEAKPPLSVSPVP